MQDKRLEEIRKNRACKRPGNEVTKQELRDAHKVKMAAKKIVRAQIHEQFSNDFAEYKKWQQSRAERIITGRQHVL